ncbi:MAG: hypothetical protein HY805_03850 [Nitrospirae bacterium]|nr:hypothetical protein [Nitrospirota bacterium]
MLKRGDIVKHFSSDQKGVVVDWGVFHHKFKRYVLAKRETADFVRVWTGGKIEVWPIGNIKTKGEAP